MVSVNETSNLLLDDVLLMNHHYRHGNTDWMMKIKLNRMNYLMTTSIPFINEVSSRMNIALMVYATLIDSVQGTFNYGSAKDSITHSGANCLENRVIKICC